MDITMSDVKLLPMSTNLSLAEGEVGVGTFDVTCPAIIQCFAIIGVRGSALIATHVTPGTNQQQMEDTFENLKGIGGDDVDNWYILGPTASHFSYSTIWKTTKAIKKTFKRMLNAKSASHSILDTSEELATMVPDARYGNMMVKTSAIDIRATTFGIGTKFHYRFRVSPRTHLTDWHEFDLTKFRHI